MAYIFFRKRYSNPCGPQPPLSEEGFPKGDLCESSVLAGVSFFAARRVVAKTFSETPGAEDGRQKGKF